MFQRQTKLSPMFAFDVSAAVQVRAAILNIYDVNGVIVTPPRLHIKEKKIELTRVLRLT